MRARCFAICILLQFHFNVEIIEIDFFRKLKSYFLFHIWVNLLPVSFNEVAH